MTEQQFLKKYQKLLTATRKSLVDNGVNLFRSGTVNASEAENDYALPKVILAVVLENMAWQWYPVSNEGKKDLANLRKF